MDAGSEYLSTAMYYDYVQLCPPLIKHFSICLLFRQSTFSYIMPKRPRATASIEPAGTDTTFARPVEVAAAEEAFELSVEDGLLVVEAVESPVADPLAAEEVPEVAVAALNEDWPDAATQLAVTSLWALALLASPGQLL